MDLTPPAPMHHQPSQEAIGFFERANFLVVKLTDYCNLRCKYCHQDALNGKPLIMPIETLKNAIRLVLGPSKAPVVYVQFHGGEPLLAPREYFEEIVSFAKEQLSRPDRKVEFCIQSNLTRVNPEREQILRELGIGISYSLDGPPAINDELRGGGKMILKNWRRLKENGVDAGTICLIQPSNWDRMDEVLSFFHDEGIHNVRFNLMVPDGRGKEVETSTTDKLFQAKKRILDYMLETKGQSVVDVTLITMMKRFTRTNGAPASTEYQGCESFYCQAGRTLYSLNPDGTFYACDRIAESPSWSMGNVNHPFDEKASKAASTKRSQFHHKDEWWSRCETCDARKICEFSCSAYYVDQVDTREIECQFTKRMWEYMVERRQDIREFMRRGIQPLSIDDKLPLRDQDEENWVVKDIAHDAFFNSLSRDDVLASNRSYHLVQRGEQYFLYLINREKIFEVDELVAQICRFNGALPPDLIEKMIADRFARGEVKKALQQLGERIPEVFAAGAGRSKGMMQRWLQG